MCSSGADITIQCTQKHINVYKVTNSFAPYTLLDFFLQCVPYLLLLVNEVRKRVMKKLPKKH